MPAKPNLLVIILPDHYALRGLQPIGDQANIFASSDAAAVREFAPSADIVINSGLTGTAIALKDIWSEAPNIKWVHSLSAGVESLLFPALVESPVPLTNARGVYKRPLAEFALLGMLYFFKNVRVLVDNQRAHRWEPFSVDWLPGKIMGVVGYGEIGRECALLAKPLGVKIYALRRRPELSATDPIVDRSFAPAQLNEMLSLVDVLVVAAPLTNDTRHLVSTAQFAAMKPTAIVINVGRGPVIDEEALIEALTHKQVAAAALDVFEHEPIRADHPFYDMENVLISPHCTDRTRDPDWLDLSMQCFIENFKRFQKGESLNNIVDKTAGY